MGRERHLAPSSTSYSPPRYTNSVPWDRRGAPSMSCTCSEPVCARQGPVCARSLTPIGERRLPQRGQRAGTARSAGRSYRSKPVCARRARLVLARRRPRARGGRGAGAARSAGRSYCSKPVCARRARLVLARRRPQARGGRHSVAKEQVRRAARAVPKYRSPPRTCAMANTASRPWPRRSRSVIGVTVGRRGAGICEGCIGAHRQAF